MLLLIELDCDRADLDDPGSGPVGKIRKDPAKLRHAQDINALTRWGVVALALRASVWSFSMMSRAYECVMPAAGMPRSSRRVRSR
jgi:hypothetical protein